MNNLTPEMLQKAKETKSIEELQLLAKENEWELTDEEAAAYYEQLNAPTGEMGDDELENVAGGGCHKKDGRLVVTIFNSCEYWTCKHCEGSDRYGSIYDKDSHICKVNLGDNGLRKPDAISYRMKCQTCKYMRYEKGLWLCNNYFRRK